MTWIKQDVLKFTILVEFDAKRKDDAEAEYKIQQISD